MRSTLPFLVFLLAASPTAPTAASNTRVANSPPVVIIESPLNGSFYDPGHPVPYRISVRDDEDGSTDDGLLPPGRILLERHHHTNGPANLPTPLPPGLQLMRASTCFACHQVATPSVGPAYLEVAQRYQHDSARRSELPRRIISGGIGAWGRHASMPPHPQFSLDQATLMAQWILSLTDEKSLSHFPGYGGLLPTPAAPNSFAPTLRLTATYTDNGALGHPPIRGQNTTLLHPRRKAAATADATHRATIISLPAKIGANPSLDAVQRLPSEGWLRFDTIRLDRITHLELRIAALAHGTYRIEARRDTPDGPLLGATPLQCPKDTALGEFSTKPMPLNATVGVSNVLILVRVLPPLSDDSAAPSPILKDVLDVYWVDFRETSAGNGSHAP